MSPFKVAMLTTTKARSTSLEGCCCSTEDVCARACVYACVVCVCACACACTRARVCVCVCSGRSGSGWVNKVVGPWICMHICRMYLYNEGLFYCWQCIINMSIIQCIWWCSCVFSFHQSTANPWVRRSIYNWSILQLFSWWNVTVIWKTLQKDTHSVAFCVASSLELHPT